MQRSSSAVAAIWLSAATTVHMRKLASIRGNAPAPSASQTMTSHATAKGIPYRNRTSVAPSAPRSAVRCRCAALRNVCANAAAIVIGIHAYAHTMFFASRYRGHCRKGFRV
jgi:hypothetical protein